ncbi:MULTISPECIES: flagellar motor switch protein FliM [Pseudovibrio]|uniref:flagellar motor switch protein FliM n=1 Tax=Stappiaceae TaxID=2821832 RepID=UPI0023673BA4|nr:MULTISPECIES: FliM/FliN family flagellar motor switch protein [Pseudovibrio]MDD7909026.1 FliM/FliN family flagellar motor switch protein [Pseudovibrio exalbescens]MDX5593653.1 FliM/FliN family flagellar motor switch protein [Pseudovibrio sp. SPO723]
MQYQGDVIEPGGYENTEETEAQKFDLPSRLLDAAGIGVDRLPMLHVVFDRMARQYIDTLRQMAASAPYIAVQSVRNDRIGDALDQYEDRAIIAVLHAQEWDARILLGFDKQFIFSMVELLLGGDGEEEAFDEDRALTSVEQRLAHKMFEEAASAMESAFEAIADVTIKVERLETRTEFAQTGRRSNQCVVCQMNAELIGREGEIFIVIPQSVLNPLRQNLTQVLSGEVAGRDTRWTKQFQHEIQKTEVKLTAVLEEQRLTLEQVAQFEVGLVLELNATPKTPVRLECNRQPLFNCKLGQVAGSYTVRIDELIQQDGDLLDDIISN